MASVKNIPLIPRGHHGHHPACPPMDPLAKTLHEHINDKTDPHGTLESARRHADDEVARETARAKAKEAELETVVQSAKTSFDQSVAGMAATMDRKQDVGARVTKVTSMSDDSHYPTAKAVYDIVSGMTGAPLNSAASALAKATALENWKNSTTFAPADARANVIETVKVNGAPLTVAGDKSVDIPVPGETDPVFTEWLENRTFAPSDAQPNVIETVKVNGAPLTVAGDKSVDIPAPDAYTKSESDTMLAAKADEFTEWRFSNREELKITCTGSMWSTIEGYTGEDEPPADCWYGAGNADAVNLTLYWLGLDSQEIKDPITASRRRVLRTGDAEPNVIERIKVNGESLSVAADKSVDIPAPDAYTKEEFDRKYAAVADSVSALAGAVNENNRLLVTPDENGKGATAAIQTYDAEKDRWDDEITLDKGYTGIVTDMTQETPQEYVVMDKSVQTVIMNGGTLTVELPKSVGDEVVRDLCLYVVNEGSSPVTMNFPSGVSAYKTKGGDDPKAAAQSGGITVYYFSEIPGSPSAWRMFRDELEPAS